MPGCGLKALRRAVGAASMAGLAFAATGAFAFETPAIPSQGGDLLFDAAFDRGPVQVQRHTATVRATARAVDRVTVAAMSAPATANVLPGAPYRDAGYEMTYTRDWPDFLGLNAGGYDLSVSPHAGVGVSNHGRRAEAGATVSIGKTDRASEQLSAMGVRDGKTFGDQSRWYMFAAVSGKSVGLNMTQSGEGAWQGAGWSQDASSSLVGDGQVGVGYRKGAMQAAFGYVHREIKVQNAPQGADNDVTDSMAAFTLSFRPHR